MPRTGWRVAAATRLLQAPGRPWRPLLNPALPAARLPACSGAVQAGVIAYFLYLASRGVDAFFDARPPPDALTQYTAHNVVVLVQVGGGCC